MLASLNHPNSATIHALEEAEGIHLLIREPVPGPTLSERLQQGRLPVREALDIARRITDKRSDILSFGILLYEMLSGRRAFTGETVSDVMAAVLTSEPDRSALPAATPKGVRVLVRRCLTKDPARRRREKPLPDAGADAYESQRAPDGRFIVFLSNASGAIHLLRMPVAGGEPQRLTTGDDRIRHISFAPDGQSIYFQPNHQKHLPQAALRRGYIYDTAPPRSSGRKRLIRGLTKGAPLLDSSLPAPASRRSKGSYSARRPDAPDHPDSHDNRPCGGPSRSRPALPRSRRPHAHARRAPRRSQGFGQAERHR